MAVVIKPGTTSVVTTGGTPVTAIPPNPVGGFIVNPLTSSEFLYVNPFSPATLVEGGTNFALQPGQSWSVTPGQTTSTSVNAASDGHVFSVVWW